MTTGMGPWAPAEDAILAREIHATAVRDGDQLEVKFRRPGDPEILLEWIEVDEVSPGLLRVGGFPIARGTEARAAAEAVVSGWAKDSGLTRFVVAATWVRP